ncbi:MAG: hypothetical protein AMS22_02840 [Thiotrichales bacterium SG8_50]|nr:MAG: hypothetical protein AMS22_02840 [Thiotrichales bacterium SG8_50]
MRVAPISFGLLLLAASAPASSAPTMQECTAIADDAERLGCYDAAAAASPAPVLLEDEPQMTALSDRWELEQATQRGRWAITPYKPNYFLLASYNTLFDDDIYVDLPPDETLDPVEAKFQISFKVKLGEDIVKHNLDLWFAYTQLAFWQVYNTDLSAPFRETNYEPEVFFLYRTDYRVLGMRARGMQLGFNHQSNGRTEPLSRSWNRLVAGALFETDRTATWLRLWYRIPESEEKDDNPDIEEYIGRGDIVVAYTLSKHTVAATLRNNLQFSDNRGSIQLDYTFPLFRNIRGYAQYFNGYGESLIQYNESSNTIGLGVLLTDWL